MSLLLRNVKSFFIDRRLFLQGGVMARRAISSDPQVLSQDAVDASVNKLSQGTLSPWEKVNICFGAYLVVDDIRNSWL